MADPDLQIRRGGHLDPEKTGPLVCVIHKACLSIFAESVKARFQATQAFYNRGGEWYHEKRGSRKILAGSRNLGSVFDKSRSLVFAWFVFTFIESRNFLPKSLGLRFLTRISASWRVSDFTICHPL